MTNRRPGGGGGMFNDRISTLLSTPSISSIAPTQQDPPAGPELGIAEGYETGLSAMRMSEVPVWCACGARLAAIDLPPVVKTVHVFADNGTPGKDAAERAADRYTHAGRRVELRYPPAPFGDWNVVIRAEAVA